MTTFAKKLLAWHSNIDRNLPWKADRNPYKIWLSEIILQQTRVAQGTPYYLKFIANYPTVTDLANAPEADILRLWQGLGYYSRARNLHLAAKSIRDDFGGIFPIKYQDILNLKGVGRYTAAAIASFAYGEEYPVVDGNVNRVISRYYGITEPVDTTIVQKEIYAKAGQLIKESDPAKYNQAIMDFGALVCNPKTPKCPNCVFQDSCKAYKDELVHIIPTKAKRTKKINRYLHYIMIHSDEELYINQRKEKGIWKGLFELPLIELSEKRILSKQEWKDYSSNLNIGTKENLTLEKTVKHVLSHQNLLITFYSLSVVNLPAIKPFQKVTFKSLDKYGFPIVIVKYLEQFQ